MTQERLRSAPIIFVIILIGLFFYLGFNHFVIPKSFLFQKTSEINGKVTETNMFNGVRGYLLQKVTDEYQVVDSVYVDSFIAGKREGHQVVGDRLLIQYSVNKPNKNKVVGFYRDSKKRNKKPVHVSSKQIE